MKIIDPWFRIEGDPDGEKILRQIELAARNCYKSEDKTDKDSHYKLIRKLINSGHHAIIEFGHVTIRFVTDRGVTHELVRHRLPSYAQESTRYCNYSKNKFNNEITVIKPFQFKEGTKEWKLWRNSCKTAEKSYMKLLKRGISPEWARSVLPNSLKTEILVDANIREWRHIFQLRAVNPFAHPQIRQIMIPALLSLHKKIPIVFDDILPKDGFRNKDGSEYPMEQCAKEKR